MGAAQEVEIPISNAHSVDGKDEKDVDFVESGSSHVQNIGWDKKSTAKLVRKMDWVLLPFLSLLYLLSFLDRTNIGNARLAGLEKDLGMTGLNYNVSIVTPQAPDPSGLTHFLDCSRHLLPLLRHC